MSHLSSEYVKCNDSFLFIISATLCYSERTTALRAHSRLAQLSRTVPKHERPPSLWYLRSNRQSQIFPLLCIWTLSAVCLNLRLILHKQSQQCRCSMLVLVHPYCTEVHLFQPCQGRQSVPCLSTDRSAHTSQTNWTLAVKHSQARYGLPSVNAP